MKPSALIVVAFVLSGCSNPQTALSKMANLPEPCQTLAARMDEVRACQVRAAEKSIADPALRARVLEPGGKLIADFAEMISKAPPAEAAEQCQNYAAATGFDRPVSPCEV